MDEIGIPYVVVVHCPFMSAKLAMYDFISPKAMATVVSASKRLKLLCLDFEASRS